MHRDAYYRLAGMTAMSFISMYILMYAMVNSFDNVFNSVNQVYTAGLMTAPMVLIELFLMGSMYPLKKLNMVNFHHRRRYRQHVFLDDTPADSGNRSAVFAIDDPPSRRGNSDV